MSEHRAVIEWQRQGRDFGEGYGRSHEWRFDSGTVVPAWSAPTRRGDPTRVDPEEAFVASIASCHMLWFLYLAGTKGRVVDRYLDDAVGQMGRNDAGMTYIHEVVLRPHIEWADPAPSPEEIRALHAESHRQCFIANSVRSVITVNGE